MSDKPPLQSEHDIRDDLDELERMHGLERSEAGEGILLSNDRVLVEATDVQAAVTDDGKVRVVCTLHVETPCLQADLRAQEISPFGIGFEVAGHPSGETALKVFCMGHDA